MSFEIGDIVKTKGVGYQGTVTEVGTWLSHPVCQVTMSESKNRYTFYQDCLIFVRTRKQETMCRHFKEVGYYSRPEDFLRDLQCMFGITQGNKMFEEEYLEVMKYVRSSKSNT